MHRHRTSALIAAALLAVPLAVSMTSSAATAQAPKGAQLRRLVRAHIGDTRKLSGGTRMWLAPPPRPAGQRVAAPKVRFGTNVDANNPGRDVAAGQSETAIAAQTAGGGRRLVMVGWNDTSAFFAPPTTAQGSGTGVGISENGGRSFTDLIGLPNNNVDQMWSGDPAVASLGDGVHFAVASLYLPSVNACTDGLPAYNAIAVTMATVRHTSSGPTVSFTAPVQVANPGDLCTLFNPNPPGNIAMLDKDWISYDPSSRTLALSYARFFISGTHSGNGQIEVVRAHVPGAPSTLSAGSFGRPIVVWPEEPFCPNGVPSSEQLRCGADNEGPYVAVATGGDIYVAWERNLVSGLFNGDPYVYEHAARIPAGASSAVRGGPASPVVLTVGQPNSTETGGVKSIAGTFLVPGYSRTFGNDFPRLGVDSRHGRVVFAWTDASHHPLGNTWLRAASLSLRTLGATQRVDDGNTYALHFLPAVSIRGDGTICTSWYDRRRGGATSTLTDYYADCRAAPRTAATDRRITTGSTDWAGTASLIDPNFGDYTDSATDGTRTYFTWSDGRIGVPQPFVDSR